MPIMRASAAPTMQTQSATMKRMAEKEKENRKRAMAAENRKSRASVTSGPANKNRPSITSYGNQVQFTTSFRFIRKKDNSPSYFKGDGERFVNDQTLKLFASVSYVVNMEVKPAMDLLFIKFAGIEYPFKLVNNPSKDGKSVYQFLWSTKGIDPTENRHRTDVICSMKFKPYKEIEFRLQVKFYDTKQERQAKFGKQLNNISLECTAGRGTYVSYVDNISLQ